MTRLQLYLVTVRENSVSYLGAVNKDGSLLYLCWKPKGDMMTVFLFCCAAHFSSAFLKLVWGIMKNTDYRPEIERWIRDRNRPGDDAVSRSKKQIEKLISPQFALINARALTQQLDLFSGRLMKKAFMSIFWVQGKNKEISKYEYILPYFACFIPWVLFICYSQILDIRLSGWLKHHKNEKVFRRY